MDKQKFNFILSSFSRVYGVSSVTEKMKSFSLIMSEKDIPFYESLDEFDRYIVGEFKNYLN